MRVLTADAMRRVDRRAIEEVGIPSLVLMENAAVGATDVIGELFPEAGEVAILCGPGNNGGDGLAVARHLANRGYGVTVLSWEGASGPQGDALVQRQICEWMGLEIHPLIDVAGASASEMLAGHDLVVDALFGTGLSRPLDGPLADLVAEIAGFPAPRLALDLPSGLSGSDAAIFGPHLPADVTVAFGAPKVAHVFLPAASAVGELVVVDLGVPGVLFEEADGDLYLLDEYDMSSSMIAREPDSHKGGHGHALLVAGSPGKTGAAVLAARGALRSGAGLVTVATPSIVAETVDAGSLESMTVALSAGDGGDLLVEAMSELESSVAGKQVLALGPGLGRSDGTATVVRRLVGAAGVPVVLDADAIHAFAGRAGDLSSRTHPTVLTPHVGELAALMDSSKDSIARDRLASATRAAQITTAIVVLKGHPTLVAHPDGTVWANPTGNSGMATGGTGDVLLGLLAGLIAQGYSADTAACLAVFLHGSSGDLAVRSKGEHSLVAGDLLEFIPAAFAELA